MTDEPRTEPMPAEPTPGGLDPEPTPEPMTPETVTPEAAAATPSTPEAGGLDRRAIGLGIAGGALAISLLLLALMVFAPSIAPVKFGAVADAQRVEQEEVEEVALRFASSLYTINYRTIDADLKKIRDDSTGNFSRELAQVLGEADVVKKAIVNAKGEMRGDVQGVDVREIAGGTATARVFVTQTIRNQKNPEPRQQFSAIELTLVDTSDGWKVDDVKQFQTESSDEASDAEDER
jgi:hypothetical protein